MSSTQRQRPQRALEGAVGQRGGHQQPDADRSADRQAGHRVAEPRVVAARHHEQHDLRRAHHAVGAGEQQRRVVERLGHAERHHEQATHGGEDREAHDPSSGSTTLVSQA